MTTWRYFARRELPRVIRQLGLPAALQVTDPTLTHCPLHQDVPLSRVAPICHVCHRLAWDEVGRRYAAQGRPAA